MPRKEPNKITVSVYLDSDTVERLEEVAENENRSRSSMASIFITEGIKDYWAK